MIVQIDDYSNAGWPKDQATLQARVSAFVRRSKRFKIGITNHPAKRASEHNAAGRPYGRMVVLYQSTSHEHAKELEKWLIRIYGERCDNLKGGGAGRIPKTGTKYVYVLLGYRRPYGN